MGEMLGNAEDVARDAASVADLKTRVRGNLLLPGDSAYDEARTIWNAMIDRRPGLIVQCLGVGDVVACVQFARQHQMRLSIKGGGHHISGLAVCDGGLMKSRIWCCRAN